MRLPAMAVVLSITVSSPFKVAYTARPEFNCSGLGLVGECEEVPACMCVCFRITQSATNVEAAYFGELGYELVLYTPYIHYLQTLGKLAKTVGPLGSQSFNFFSPNHTEVPFTRRWCPGPSWNKDPHAAVSDFHFDEWIPPNFKEFYRDRLPALSRRPLLIIHNKHTREWDKEPVNFIDIPTLLLSMDMLKRRYTIVYVRPHSGQHLRGYAGDHNTDMQFGDFEAIKEAHPDIHLAHELLDQFPEMKDFNELQLALHAQADAFISVLGGNAVIASYFAGTNIVYAVKGHEATNHEYVELYPRLGPQGQGRNFQAHDYSELLSLVDEHLLS